MKKPSEMTDEELYTPAELEERKAFKKKSRRLCTKIFNDPTHWEQPSINHPLEKEKTSDE